MHLKRLCGNLLPLLVATSVGLAVTAKAAEEKASPENQPSGAPSSVRQMQQDFLKLKFGMFIHFNLETFKGVQWVAGYHSPADFNPGGKIDTDAWADAAVSAGMKYAVKEMRHFPEDNKAVGETCWELEQGLENLHLGAPPRPRPRLQAAEGIH